MLKLKMLVLWGSVFFSSMVLAEGEINLSELNQQQNQQVDQVYSRLMACVNKARSSFQPVSTMPYLQKCYQLANKELMKINLDFANRYHQYLEQIGKSHSEKID